MIYIDINKLKTNEENPRTIKDYEFKKLCKSIQNNKKFFESRPVIVDHEYKVIAGNQRYNASKHIGLKEIPVYVLPKDISKEELDAIMLMDNRHNGEWDWNKLTSNFDILFLKDEIGFTNEEYSFDKIIDETINQNSIHIQDEKEKVMSDIQSGKIKITLDMLSKDVKDEIIEELKQEKIQENKNKIKKENPIDYEDYFIIKIEFESEKEMINAYEKLKDIYKCEIIA